MKFEKREELWKVVNDAYDCDSLIMDYVNMPGHNHGDGLAEFIVRELGDAEDVTEAIRMMETARAQIQRVIEALDGIEDDKGVEVS